MKAFIALETIQASCPNASQAYVNTVLPKIVAKSEEPYADMAVAKKSIHRAINPFRLSCMPKHVVILS